MRLELILVWLLTCNVSSHLLPQGELRMVFGFQVGILESVGRTILRP